MQTADISAGRLELCPSTSVEGRQSAAGQLTDNAKAEAAPEHRLWKVCRQTVSPKSSDFIHEAAMQGAQFIAFPESFLPGFPIWAALWAPIENHAFFREMVANSIFVG